MGGITLVLPLHSDISCCSLLIKFCCLRRTEAHVLGEFLLGRVFAWHGSMSCRCPVSSFCMMTDALTHVPRLQSASLEWFLSKPRLRMEPMKVLISLCQTKKK